MANGEDSMVARAFASTAAGSLNLALLLAAYAR